VYEDEDARLLVEAPEMRDLLTDLRAYVSVRDMVDIVGYDFAERLYAVLQRIEGRNDEPTRA
jgi:hypothetical protein